MPAGNPAGYMDQRNNQQQSELMRLLSGAGQAIDTYSGAQGVRNLLTGIPNATGQELMASMAGRGPIGILDAPGRMVRRGIGIEGPPAVAVDPRSDPEAGIQPQYPQQFMIPRR